jgi:uncharacterized protein
LIEKGYHVIVLTRGKSVQDQSTPELKYAEWDITKQYVDRESIEQTDYIIHLAGAGIADKRWTKKRKKEIVDSRVEGGKLIAKSLAEIPNKVKAVISASAIGWYGADPVIPNPDPFKETDPPNNDFLGETCRKWEFSTATVTQLNKRDVHIRTGIVLSKNGGALKEFLKPLQFGIAPVLGSGTQVISWIHVNDLVGIYLMAIENEKLNGAYNAVATHPVTNRDFVLQFAKARKKFYFPFPVPAFLLKILKGEMSIEVLKSATISNEKIRREGFEFSYTDIHSAFKEITD